MPIINTMRRCIYPHGKVHVKYGSYLRWSFVSNLIISIESVLSTHSMLSAVGAANTEMVVSINYIGKDIIGQIGGMIFINRFGQKVDKEPKKFIKYAMTIQQISLLAECSTPLLPVDYFLPIASTANMGKNISFTGFGAINATIIPKLALDNNIGEIYAKLSIVNTLGSTLGMGIGLSIATFIPDHETRLCLMPILGVMRYYTYKIGINKIFENDL